MNTGFKGFVAPTCVTLLLLAASPKALALSFEERVMAQEAIERVYYSHQVGAMAPFEEAIPAHVIEAKVRRYLKQSAALEELWDAPITAHALQGELDRVARGTRMPERLREIYAALDDDPLLIAECVARPVLADRLVKGFFAGDERAHDETRRRAEELRERLLLNGVDAGVAPDEAVDVTLLRSDATGKAEPVDEQAFDLPRGQPTIELSHDEFENRKRHYRSRVGLIGPVEESNDRFVIEIARNVQPDEVHVTRFVIPKMSFDDWWRDTEATLDADAVGTVSPADVSLATAMPGEPGAEGTASTSDCVPDDTWDNGALYSAPDSLHTTVSVWTGSLMLVWGGVEDGGFEVVARGGRYDPATDTWTSISAVDDPEQRIRHTAVWTGDRLLVWGGYDNGAQSYWNTGGQYDPVADTWTAISTTGAPEGRENHTAVWAGNEMIVWGGRGPSSGYPLDDGGRYDPVTDTWSAMETAGAPAPMSAHTAVWTGSEMIVWGEDPVKPGGRYDPASNIWTPMSVTGAPEPGDSHTAMWTGEAMLLWGAAIGASYDPETDSWESLSTIDAPEPRTNHTAVWSGTEMIVWGGDRSLFEALDTGGRYDPLTDTWSPTTTENAPENRRFHTAVWADGLMIVWGGQRDINAGFAPLDSGGRYDPASDTWTPTRRATGPSPRESHTAVWTGSHMLVWGGFADDGEHLNTGGRYDPATDSWNSMSNANPPAARSKHTTVWTGQQMLVWGGKDETGILGSGGSYDPGTDSWMSISTEGAPEARRDHTAVWTGSEMIIWGGELSNTGGRYNPTTNSWATTSVLGAPTGRSAHTAVWTGSRMIVWGGRLNLYGGLLTKEGGRYDPVTDEWLSTTTDGAPTERWRHSAVWTGDSMIVWGGWHNLGYTFRSGGRYDPSTDSWAATSIGDAPVNRQDHTAVWTGHEMVVWGGARLAGGHDWQDNGGRYDPEMDFWTPVSRSGAPSPRWSHTAVWTGSAMIVWGGGLYTHYETGGRYTLGHSTDDDGDGFSECAGDCNDDLFSVFPGGHELCDGLDNDCDGIPDNGAGAPGLTFDLRFSSPVDFHWMTLSGASSYDVAKGNLSLLRETAGDYQASVTQCLDVEIEGREAVDLEPAGEGEAFFYLVRARGCGERGSYDSGGQGQVAGRDAAIAGSACP